MKKILSVFLALSMVLSVFALGSFAAGEKEALSYDPSSSLTPGSWLNRFDKDGNCEGYSYVIFNAGAPFTAIVLPALFAGKSANSANVDVRFELYKYDGEKATSLASSPVFRKDVNVDGDQVPYSVEFNKTMPAGQYIFMVTQLSANPGLALDPGPYSVLPLMTSAYDSNYLEYFSTHTEKSFAFSVIYDGSVSSTAFFKKIDSLYENDSEITVAERDEFNPYQLNQHEEYAVLTALIPQGKVLRYFTLKDAPTWSNTGHNSDLGYEVYVWDTDYDTTVGKAPVLSGEVEDHSDNQDLVINFRYKLKGGQRYLIVLFAADDGPIGFWGGTDSHIDGWEFFEDGNDVEVYPASTYMTAKYNGPDESDILLGDADGDGEVSDWDAITFERYLAGWNVDPDLTALDLDDDGEISDWDAIMLARFLAGWNVTFG